MVFNKVYIGVILALLLATSGLMWKNQSLKADLEEAEKNNVLMELIVSGEVANTKLAASKLKQCVDENARLEENARQAVTDLAGRLADAEQNVRVETRIIREALSSEACANTAVPAGVENSLRDISQRINKGGE